jgi:hypothetical protein
MGDHNGLWRMGSFIKCDTSFKSNVSKKGNGILENEYWVEDEASCEQMDP